MKYIVTNNKTSKRRTVSISNKMLENDLHNCTSKCSGSCKCTTDFGGDCPNGWPARTKVVFAPA